MVQWQYTEMFFYSVVGNLKQIIHTMQIEGDGRLLALMKELELDIPHMAAFH